MSVFFFMASAFWILLKKVFLTKKLVINKFSNFINA